MLEAKSKISSEQNQQTAESNEAQLISIMVFAARRDSTKILQPCEKAFDFSAAFIPGSFRASRVFARLRLALGGEINSTPKSAGNCLSSGSESPALPPIKRSVATSVNRSGRVSPTTPTSCDEADSVQTARGKPEPSAIAVSFVSQAPLGCSNLKNPFFATIKVPSIKHSDSPILPRECKSAEVSNTCLSLRLLNPMLESAAASLFMAEIARAYQISVRRTQNPENPFITSSSALRDLPGVTAFGGLSNNGSIKILCLSVSSSRNG